MFHDLHFSIWQSFVLLVIKLFSILYAGICDEMLELYGGGKKKEKIEASDEGSSSNHSSPLPSSSPPTKKRVSHLQRTIIIHDHICSFQVSRA